MTVMDTVALNAAERTLTYPSHTLPTEERERLRAEYHTAQNAMVSKWKTWLASEHADGLPEGVQDRIYSAAWDEGHSSGYHEIEHYYIMFAGFARDVRNV
jgi:hypothetical protein